MLLSKHRNLYKMTHVIYTLMISLTFSIKANAQGVVFEPATVSLQQLKARARQENKYIFLDLYATWCGPCKEMDVKTYPDAGLGEWFNIRFVSAKVQMDKSKQDAAVIKDRYADAELLSREYGVSAFPTMLFLSPEGKLVYKTAGFMAARELKAEAEKAIDRYENYQRQLTWFRSSDKDKKQLDTAKLKILVKAAREMKDGAIVFEASELYVGQLSRAAVFEKENLEFIGTYLSAKSRYFPLFFKQAAKVNVIMGKDFAENKVMDLVKRELVDPYSSVLNPDWDKMEKQAKLKYEALGEETVWAYRLAYYFDKQNNWPLFGKYYKLYFDRVVPLNRSKLHINNMSWLIFEHVTDPAVLQTAVKAMQYELKSLGDKDPNTIDTYACLLYKSGKRNEAIQWEEKAVALSNNGKDFVNTLDKMKKGIKIWEKQP